ncbi:hypothetical protein MBM_07743 [Drepanopeziza brunnea f. sp. 'multigermtubi' MB_m1]|uniref:Uncharacterized protein n=1 Tax=Marssonina brunnea f. sp. multigermtubi (strain MB_m1) TaxID=1072389 RepID=K1WMI6_MARBU|nr:uncharacterized protein MBM_07743 [Drepanopeziza brunnea f. sp. 'multigermtubi' MB_m1]EKD14066.1 hypothetical protein MBM_07743 [Drepanopeziza brunnea f. sp. 'multigermtubi' MB_m1]
MAAAAAAAAATAPILLLRAPSIYPPHDDDDGGDGKGKGKGKGSRSPWRAPPLAWLERTWSVTHSTLPMWAKARNVRITYKLLSSPSPPSSGAGAGGRTLIDDEVCSEPLESGWVTAVMQPRCIRGVDTPVPGLEGGWRWRGRGWLRVASSHWEILGWGESDLDGVHEKWVVTWFKASLFTPMGVDVYSDRKEGISEGLYGKIREALEGGLAGTEVAELCKGMFAVEIKY